MLRSALLGAAFLGLAAPAFAATFTFETAQPLAKDHYTLEGAVWTCDGTTCTGDLNRKKITVVMCKKIAKKTGEIVSFTSKDFELSAEDLEACKAAISK
ncbi:MAG TPA: hypothetical protein PLR76_04890 [Hyphomonas sp.]|nr:hypothetical protein [Hyphomonas sp.]MCB9962446.1 hypothetical protein [Hyphomonas sp.]MCB9972102.1 hypothetical protein [Hyphomonas sp.]HPE47707.1 hypothetical protein [Hyphomonas sp.]HRX37112.1 hypothetical protein [Aestuariivirga sp.]